MCLRPTIVVCTALVTLCGCSGYWSSNKSKSAGSYTGKETFGESSKPLPVEAVILGVTQPERQAAEALAKASTLLDRTSMNDKALVFADCGIAAAHSGDSELAARLLDEAVESILSITATGPREIRVTSLTGSESEKIFKGEPHERAVALLYRGLLFMAVADIDNAQACFKAGALESAAAAKREDRAKWLTLDLLLAVCKRIQQEPDLPEWLDYIRTAYPAEATPINIEQLPRNPFILLAVVGGSPDKIAGRTKGEELQYCANQTRVASLKLTAENKQPIRFAAPTDDCYVQAVSRGRRKMDEVLTSKANVRRGVETTGAVISGVAPLVPFAGPILMFAREASWGISDTVKSGADVRQMRMVPGSFFLGILDADQLQAPLRIEMVNRESRTIGEGSIQVAATTKGVQVALIRFPY